MFQKGHKINAGKRNAAKTNHAQKDFRLLFTLEVIEENKDKIKNLLHSLLDLPDDTDVKIKLDVARLFTKYAFALPVTQVSLEQQTEKKYTPENVEAVLKILEKEGYSTEDSANICLLFAKIQKKLSESDASLTEVD